MIQQRAEPAARVVEVEVSGKLRHEDFAKLQTWIGAAVASHRKCGLLVVFADFHGWDVQSLWDDIKFHSTGCGDVARIAYVGDKAWEQTAIAVSRPITGSPVRYFHASALDAARAWVARA
jgi:hypothetical protein